MDTIIFRADARSVAGGGHMSRCLSLARALRRSFDVVFSLEPEAAPMWHARLRDESFDIIDDASRISATVGVLDGYDLQPSDIATWTNRVNCLVMIEDFGQRFSGVDLYVSFSGPPPSNARVLAGPKYALLDARYARPVEPLDNDSRKILVACGLRDSANITDLYLNSLMKCSLRSKTITVVLGSAALHRQAVQDLACSIGANVLFDVLDMSALYDDADLVLGAGGVSLFERVARGRASITVIASENQAYSAIEMARIGGTLLAGSVESTDENMIAKSIDRLLSDYDMRNRMGTVARQAVDGLGANRVANEILMLTVDVTNRALAAAKR